MNKIKIKPKDPWILTNKRGTRKAISYNLIDKELDYITDTISGYHFFGYFINLNQIKASFL